jgi:hypothetical protein
MRDRVQDPVVCRGIEAPELGFPFKSDITGFRQQDCAWTDGQVRYWRRPFADMRKFMASVQTRAKVAAGGVPFSVLGTCAPVAYSPHARVSAEQGNF